MFKFAEYYQDMDNSIVGSDSILPIDGRYGYFRAVQYVLNHPHTKYVKENFKCVGFKICRGSVKDRVYESDMIVFVEDKTK